MRIGSSSVICDMCKAPGSKSNKSTTHDQVPKMPNALPKHVEAKGDGGVHDTAFCQLCLRSDVCGGLKQTNDKGAAIWVHEGYIQCIPEAFNTDSKIHFKCKGKEIKVANILTKNAKDVMEFVEVSRLGDFARFDDSTCVATASH